MNLARIAAEALRYRLDLVRGPLVNLTDWDIETMAGMSVAAADPNVDGAIRRIATAWVRAGLPRGRALQAVGMPGGPGSV